MILERSNKSLHTTSHVVHTRNSSSVPTFKSSRRKGNAMPCPHNDLMSLYSDIPVIKQMRKSRNLLAHLVITTIIFKPIGDSQKFSQFLHFSTKAKKS